MRWWRSKIGEVLKMMIASSEWETMANGMVRSHDIAL